MKEKVRNKGKERDKMKEIGRDEKRERGRYKRENVRMKKRKRWNEGE